ncbi:2539_t:CDS:2 [Paraglomus brasilianum]|uniref:2539_t:CDS:1 n=1 Tax=Paraglomus brasilianum TaxID=144538 RepID=A0A9N9GPV1_9GLOM|nr:2539_t:CDS:2 [Paraglomus brasilianum]
MPLSTSYLQSEFTQPQSVKRQRRPGTAEAATIPTPSTGTMAARVAYNYVTPRHFLDFINHCVRLSNEIREDLEEQQRHLNIGLEKLRDTVDKVEELRISLNIKEGELKAKNAETEEKYYAYRSTENRDQKKKPANLKNEVTKERTNNAATGGERMKDRYSVELSCETEKGYSNFGCEAIREYREDRADVVMMDFANQETWYVGLLTLQQSQWNWDISFVENSRLSRNNKRISVLDQFKEDLEKWQV